MGPWEEQDSLILGKQLTRAHGGKHSNALPQIESTKSGFYIVQIRGTDQASLEKKSTTIA